MKIQRTQTELKFYIVIKKKCSYSKNELVFVAQFFVHCVLF